MKNKLKALVAGTLGVCAMAMVGVAKVNAVDATIVYNASNEETTSSNTGGNIVLFSNDDLSVSSVKGYQINEFAAGVSWKSGSLTFSKAVLPSGSTSSGNGLTVTAKNDGKITLYYTISNSSDFKSGKVGTETISSSNSSATFTNTAQTSKVAGVATVELTKGSSTEFSTSKNRLVIFAIGFDSLDITKYDVTFNSNGGTTVDTQTVVDGKTASQPTNPTKEGYKFIGWYTDEACTDGNEVDFSQPITSAVTYYAKWVETSTTTVSLDANGGTVNNNSLVITEGNEYTLETPKRSGYFVFDGWYNGETKVESKGVWTSTDSTMTLTAKWTEVNELNYTASSFELFGSTKYESNTLTFANSGYVQDSETLEQIFTNYAKIEMIPANSKVEISITAKVANETKTGTVLACINNEENSGTLVFERNKTTEKTETLTLYTTSDSTLFLYRTNNENGDSVTTINASNVSVKVTKAESYDVTATFLAQYDTKDAASAKKIRFVAMIDNVVDPSAVASVKFTLKYNDTDCEFSCKNLYKSVTNLGSYTNAENRYYAVYTLTGTNIENAITARKVLSSLKVTVTFTDDSSVEANHTDITLGSTLA